MHICVTGGGGFIGTHVTERLLLEGHRVLVIDDDRHSTGVSYHEWQGYRRWKKNVLECDWRELPKDLDAVIHLAAVPSTQAGWEDPMESHASNLTATLQTIEWCRRLRIRRLVLASSAAIYGRQTRMPIRESSEGVALTPYGLQKAMCESYGRMYAKAFGYSFIALRLFNVYGPLQRPDSPYSGVISLFMEAMRRRNPITVFGDGRQTRDFVHVQDVAEAFTRAAALHVEPGNSRTINVGTGARVDLNRLLARLADSFGYSVPVRYLPARAGDIEHSCADISSLGEVLAFNPQWSIERGLAELANESNAPCACRRFSGPIKAGR